MRRLRPFFAAGVALAVGLGASALVTVAPACRHAPVRPVAPEHPGGSSAALDAGAESAPPSHEASAPPSIPARPEPLTTFPSAAPLVATRDLGAPKDTVRTQLALLSAGRIDAFRETLLSPLRPSLTAELFAACQHRIRQTSVLPDWEMAEERVIEGHRVIRVSMFGKSMTGFHDIGGRWLADAVWCRPPMP